MRKPANFNPKTFGKVGVFLGGKSRERVISLRSGKAIFSALKGFGIDVVRLDPAKGLKRLLARFPIDLAFVALHGRGGEDGEIQGVLESQGIAFVGSSAQASALAFDKSRAKTVFDQFKIPTPEYVVLNGRNQNEILDAWRPPFVIKPIDEGSSIGVAFIESAASAGKKIKSHLARYKNLLIEKKIAGREFTVGILGDEVLPVIELKPKRAFYDYRAKYTKGLTEYLVPAPIAPALAAQLQALALKTHRVLGLRDLSRVDILLDREARPYVLEANSIPGFTETSLLPKAANHIGINFEALCLKLLQMAAVRRKIGLVVPNAKGNGAFHSFEVRSREVIPASFAS